MRLSFKNRKGIALPMTILVITALTAAIAAGFAGAAGEFTTNAAQRSQNRAYHIAQTGLEQFMVLRSSTGWCQHCGDPALADSEWTRIPFPAAMPTWSRSRFARSSAPRTRCSSFARAASTLAQAERRRHLRDRGADGRRVRDVEHRDDECEGGVAQLVRT